MGGSHWKRGGMNLPYGALGGQSTMGRDRETALGVISGSSSSSQTEPQALNSALQSSPSTILHPCCVTLQHVAPRQGSPGAFLC